MNAYDLSKETLFDLVVQYKNTIEQQAVRIKELEKYVGFKNSGYDIISANVPKAKTLTDEEIWEVWNTLPYDDQSPFGGRGTYNFARAILRKAQEK